MSAENREPSTILVPVDFDDVSRRAVDYAVALAKALGDRIVILHVVPPTSFPEGTKLLPMETTDPVDIAEYVSTRARRLLAETFIDSLAAGVEVAREARSGHPTETILKAIDERKASLVVVGTHARTGVERVLLGSVAEGVVRRSRVPVLVVRPPEPPVEASVPQPRALAGAATLSGAVAGAAVGALAGPAGAIAGGAIGSIVGAVAGKGMVNEELRERAHERELDATLGVR